MKLGEKAKKDFEKDPLVKRRTKTIILDNKKRGSKRWNILKWIKIYPLDVSTRSSALSDIFKFWSFTSAYLRDIWVKRKFDLSTDALEYISKKCLI